MSHNTDFWWSCPVCENDFDKRSLSEEDFNTHLKKCVEILRTQHAEVSEEE